MSICQSRYSGKSEETYILALSDSACGSNKVKNRERNIREGKTPECDPWREIQTILNM